MLHRGTSSTTRRAPLSQINRSSSSNENDLTMRQFGGKQQQKQGSNFDASVVEKTPARSTSTKRRALGDISNRKAGQGSVSIARKDLHQKSAVKQSPKKHQTPRQASTSFVLPKATGKSSIKRKSTGAPPPKRVVSFSLPSETQQFRRQSQKTKPSLTPAKPNLSKLLEDDVPDVEFPAGRLWKHEMDEEEDFSIVEQIRRDQEAVEAFEQAEYERVLEKQRQHRKRQDEELDRQVNEMLKGFDEDFNFCPSDEEEEVISLTLEEDIDMYHPGDISL